MQIAIARNEHKDKKGIVTNPNHSINFVVHEIPAAQGVKLSGIMFQYKRL